MSARQDYLLFWDLTPAEITRIIYADRDRQDADFEQTRLTNHELAGWIGWAHHQPDKMPKYKPLTAKAATDSDEAEQARARGAFIALALRSKG